MSLPIPTGRRRTQSGNAALIVLALLMVVVLGAAAWYFLFGRPSAPAMTEAAARKAPASTQVFMAFDVERTGLSQVEQMKILATLLKSPELQALNKTLQEKVGLTLEEDFLTWVIPSGALIMAPAEGKKSLLEVPQDQPAAAKELPPFRFLAVLKVRDEAKARASLEKVQQKASAHSGVTYKAEDFQAATMNLPEKPGEGPAWAVHGGYLYVGFTAEDLKMGLSTPAAGQSLADQPGYKEALAKVQQHDGFVMYADLKGMLQAAPLAQMSAPDAEKLVSALRYAVFGAGQVGGEVLSEWYLVVDAAQAGPLGTKVFSPAFNLPLRSAEVFPKETDAFFVVNLRMVWDVVYEIAGAFPQGREYREAPARFLAGQKIDLEKDVLGMLTGELAYGVQNMGVLQATQLEALAQGDAQNPQATVEGLKKVPLLFSLGLKDRASLDKLLAKLPQVGMMLSSLPTTEVEGVKVHAVPASGTTPEGALAFAFTDQDLLFGVTDGKKSLEAALKARKSKENLAALPGLAKVLGKLGSDNKAFFAGYQDLGRIYTEAAAALKASGKVSPEFAQAFEQLGALYGSTWTAGAVRPDGFYGVSTMELHPKK